jgi:hypothetical protein
VHAPNILMVEREFFIPEKKALMVLIDLYIYMRIFLEKEGGGLWQRGDLSLHPSWGEEEERI